MGHLRLLSVRPRPPFGEVLNLIVEQRLRDALKAAVDRGEEPVNRLVAASECDVILAYKRKKNDLSNLRVTLVAQYNIEQQKASPDLARLRSLAEQIRSHQGIGGKYSQAPILPLDSMP